MTEKSAYNYQQPTANSQQPTANSQQRNLFLDVAKGIAIILVVIGHEIPSDTVSYWLIYSFHMPFFMFVSGMVFSLKFEDIPYQKLNASREIMKSVRGLLMPYIIWTLIYCITEHRSKMAGYLMEVSTICEGSLWFLIILFYCRVFFLLIHSLYVKFSRSDSIIAFACVMILAYIPILLFSPLDGRGQILGIGNFRTQFPYFASGFFLYKFRERLSVFFENISANVIMIFFFLSSVLLYQNNPDQVQTKLAEFSVYAVILLKILKRLAAICGTFIALSFARLIVRSNLTRIITFLSFTGKMTMGIYVFHWYFLKMFPPFIVPFLASIAITVIVEKIPLLRSLLLGK